MNNENANYISLAALTEKEKNELKLLRELQADRRRWLSMEEFNRIKELSKKQLQGENKAQCEVCGSSDVIEGPHMGKNCNNCNPII